MKFVFRVFFHILQICLPMGLMVLAGCEEEAASSPDFTEKRARYEQQLNNITTLEGIDSLKVHFAEAGDELGKMMAHRFRGDLLRKKSRFADALDAYHQELKIAERLKDTLGIMSALNNLGTVYRRLGVWEQGAACHYKGLSYYHRFSHQNDSASMRLASMLSNGVGNIHLHLGNLSVADSTFRNSIAISSVQKNLIGLAINYANLGCVFEEAGQMDSAWHYYRASMGQNLAVGSDLGLSLCHTHFGRMYEKENQWNKAAQEYLLAKSLLDIDEDRWHWLEPSIALCRLYIHQGKNKEAQKLLREVDSTAVAINSKRHLSEIYELRYQMAKLQGNTDKALYYHIKHTDYEDSLRTLVESNKIINLRINHQHERVSREIEAMNDRFHHQLRVKQIMFWTTFVVFILSLGVIALMAYAIAQRRRMQESYRTLAEERANFFANVTHEFRTPLTVILGLGDQLAKGIIPMGESPEQMGALIHCQSHQLLKMVNQLLELTRVRTNTDEPKWRRGNIMAFTQMVVQTLEDMARRKSVEFHFQADPGSFECVFEPDTWLKIVQILTSKAIKYAPENTSIEITMTANEMGNIRFTISDKGPGIPEEIREHIFDLYVAGSIANSHIGTNISLALVYQLVQNLNGAIRVDSEVGQGTTFIVELPPVSKEPNVEALDAESFLQVFFTDGQAVGALEGTPWSPVDNSDSCSQNDKQPLVLVVEDRPDVSRYIGMLLSNNFRLLFSSSCEEGLEIAESSVPDLILTEMSIKEGIDGIEFCRNVRNSAVLNHVPLVVLSAQSESSARVSAIKAGADAYLQKPFEPEELQVVVDQLLTERRMKRDNYFSTRSDILSSPLEGFNLRDQNFLLKLDEAITAQIRKDAVNIDDLASLLCMSASQLRRKTLSLTGEKVTAYILRIRMGLARKYLAENSDMSISEIASRCGFYDAAHFSKQFKQFYQMNPTQYRRRLLVEPPAES